MPTLMPASATATGRPIAMTEPKAMMRITTANARPITSDEGSSNSAKLVPPTSTRRPSISGAVSAISVPDLGGAAHVVSSGISMSA